MFGRADPHVVVEDFNFDCMRDIVDQVEVAAQDERLELQLIEASLSCDDGRHQKLR